MSTHDFALPDIGEGLLDAEIVEWLVTEGSTINEYDPLVVVQTDKADTEVSSPVNGTVIRFGGQPGDRILVGATLAVFETDTPGAHKVSAHDQVPTTALAPPATTPTAVDVDAPPGDAIATPKPMASPAVRRHARNAGVDLETVTGTGAHGRISRDDVDRHLASPEQDTPSASTPVVPTGETTRLPFRGVRRTTAETMQHSARTIPHVYDWREVDATNLFALRKQLQSQHPDVAQHISLLPLIAKFVAVLLPTYPDMNATLDTSADEIVRHGDINIGIATATGAGLIVPVLRHVDAMTIVAVATGFADLIERARNRTATAADMQGGTITLNNLGGVNGHFGSPLIRPPESSIVAFGRARDAVIAVEGQPAVRRVLPMSIAADHRLVDGDQLCGFGAALGALIEHPQLAIGLMR